VIIREELIKLRNELHKLRSQHVAAKTVVDELRKHDARFQTEKLAAELLKGAETDFRAKLLEFYIKTQDTKPIDGVTIKQVTTVQYDRVAAYKWALDRSITMILGLHAKRKDVDSIVDELYNSATFMTLDVSAFEAATKGGLTGLPTQLVKMPQVNVASDLSIFVDDAADM